MCYQSNQFINIRFADNDVVKMGAGGETYGIQIKQDYYSSNYGDHGYLIPDGGFQRPRESIHQGKKSDQVTSKNYTIRLSIPKK